MAVVALRRPAQAAPRSTAVEQWFVQTYWKSGYSAATGSAQRFAAQEPALRAGRMASRTAGGALVYKVKGDLVADLWGEPVVVARFGQAPLEP